MTNKETIVAIRRLISDYVDGGHDALETVEAIADLVAPVPRCTFIRDNYTVHIPFNDLTISYNITL